MKTATAAARVGKRRASEQGSAYIIALLVLVVLTILGLALAMITQTEMQIGASERITTRTLYSADSGIGLAVARVLVNNDHTATTVFLAGSPSSGTVRSGHRVELTPFHPILYAPCNLCAVNQGQEFLTVNHAIAATSGRVLWAGSPDPEADAPTQSRKTVGAIVEIQPWRMTSESVESLDLEDGELDRIKF